MSLQTKLFIWLCAPLTVLWCAGVIAAYLLTQRMVGLAFDQNLLDAALAVATQIKGSDSDGLPHIHLSPNDERMLLFDPVDEIRYGVFDREGSEIAGSRDVPRPANALQPGKHVFYDSTLRTLPMRWVAVELEQMDEDDPKPIRSLIVIGETLHKREAIARQTLYVAVLPQLALVTLLGGMVWFALRHGLRPLRELRQRLQERSEMDLHPIAIESNACEIEDLRDAVNALMLRLDRTLAAQSEFIGNAAHQLRTPLAVLKARLEYAGRKCAIEQDTLHELGKSTERCIRLVNQLLALAQVDATHSYALARTRVDIVNESRGLIADMTEQALAKNIDLGLETAAESLFAVTNAMLLLELLRNLVDNALHYTPAGGRVTLQLEETGDRVLIGVVDNGPGISATDYARIFDRFYRGDGAQESGSGLGLSIARRCATVIGGDLSLVPTQRGACFRVTLPRDGSFSAHPPQARMEV